MKVRYVLLECTDRRSILAFENGLKRYGVVLRLTNELPATSDIYHLLQNPVDNQHCIAVCKLECQLRVASERGAEEDSFLSSYMVIGDEIVYREYRHSVSGQLKGTPEMDLNAEWSSLFIPNGRLLSYNEVEKTAPPIASPDMVVADFIVERLYYKRPVNHNFDPVPMQRSIDFTLDPANVILKDLWLNNPVAKQYRLSSLYRTVLNRGLFFRASKNRREKNYWCPGLNAGLPLTPKRDPIHQITFMAHDLGHFLIPDLIYTGESSSFHRRVYIIYRMMSEAFTLVLTDMVFVDSMKQAGLEYDYTKRKIYPLFEDLGIDLSDPNHFMERIELLLRAGVNYCLRGSDADFRRLLEKNSKGEENLNLFKEKYMPFFVEDFRWTDRNYRSLSEQSYHYSDWWEAVSPIRDEAGIELESISEFAGKLCESGDDLVDQIFAVLSSRIMAILSQPQVEVAPFDERVSQAFRRYMIGQMAFFCRYQRLDPEIRIIHEMLASFLMDRHQPLTAERVEVLRGTYGFAVDRLRKKGFISVDDAETYKELFPIFEPFYVHYDEEEGFYRDLADESHRILSA